MVLFANRYQEDQIGGRGFLGLATLVFGNWRPAGVAAGAGLFGYFQGITLRDATPSSSCSPCSSSPRSALGVAAAVSPPSAGSGRRCSSAASSPSACGWLYVVAEAAEQPVRLHHPVRRHADRRVGPRPGLRPPAAGRHPVAQGHADLSASTRRERSARARRRRCCTTTSTAACGRRRSSSSPTRSAGRLAVDATSTSCRRGSPRGAEPATSCSTSRRSSTRSP